MGYPKRNTRYGRGNFKTNETVKPGFKKKEEEVDEAERLMRIDKIDEKMGFSRQLDGEEKLGWLVNMQPTVIIEQEYPDGRAGVDLYFITESEESFKATFLYKPYFLVLCKDGSHSEIDEQLSRRFNETIDSSEILIKEDLSLPNHLAGHKRKVLKLIFRNVNDMMVVRKFVMPLAQANENSRHASEAYSNQINEGYSNNKKNDKDNNGAKGTIWSNILGIREYDVPYLCRAAIDVDLRVGLWYNVKPSKDNDSELIIQHRPDLVKRADPVVFAFDIETSKLPLKFPDATFDMVMMVSYMVNGQGFLITNREVISEDIEDFEYTPKPDLEGYFEIFNEPDEKALLQKFFSHIRKLKPTVMATYNGDFFDWPFIDTRATHHGLNMYEEIGFSKDDAGEYKSSYCIHMDCLAWVKRDSYLPAGSHGLKAVTTSKLGYHPLELDPEDMLRFAREQPQVLAQYSVSDAVATYYLYMKYVHPFVFSLCNIIPTMPDEVLRKGSGTLCEYLLMVEAYKANVVMPNKHTDDQGKLFNGHMLESETYVGGHVEALEAGVFRSDIPSKFQVQRKGIQQLIDQLHDALKFSLEVEGGASMDQVTNYDEIYNIIKSQLELLLSDTPISVNPLIYHLDVGAMYPNIILTNRLQPDAIIDEATCASCDFNRPDKVCERKMTWSWRGEYYPAKQGDVNMIRHQLASELFPGRNPKDPPRPFSSLPSAEQNEQIKMRVAQYCRKVYNRIRESKVIERESSVCQRENPFYIDTVRSFRDRRYEYKGLHKKWKGELDQAIKDSDASKVEEAKKLIIVYDSLQLAHKCILNSFYGYVMRKGSRWYSMEMGGIVCLTGAKIIQMARQLVEQIGRPLELDTDGIWCILPSGFPENFLFKLNNGKKVFISYPCTMLNHLVHAQFTNDQYHDLIPGESRKYNVKSENSIFFEVDGPYRAMILPSSKEADKLLKKRYAVFNHDGSLAELKGFEIKRRGELKLIKIFQSQIFGTFLSGATLKECYAEVAKVADQWLDILFTKGQGLQDGELFELIAENRSMSKSLAEYGAQKSTSISTAKRLAEFLGDEMVKDKGLACQFIVSKLPAGLPVSERAIPVAIFSTEEAIKVHYLKKWTKNPAMDDFDIRTILDWDYYIERFGSVIQKLITIPAAMQHVSNPVPRVPHPEWLAKRVANRDDKFQQRRITDMFAAVDKKVWEKDIEDFGGIHSSHAKLTRRVTALVRKRKEPSAEEALKELKEQPKPLVNGNYSEFISYQRKKWKLARQIKTQNLPTAILAPTFKYNKNSGISNYVKMSMPYLFQSFQIVDIALMDQPGMVKVWVLTESQLHGLKVKVDRKFYINSQKSRVIDENASNSELSPLLAKPTKFQLPRNYLAHHVQSLTMSEQFYQDNFNEFTNLFCHHNIEGVYETKIEPNIRVMLEMGCMASIRTNVTSSPPQIFELDQFHMEPIKKGSYLNKRLDMNYLVVLHETQGLRHMILVYNSSLGIGSMFVVDGPKKPTSQLPSLSSTFARFQEQHITAFGLESTPHLSFPPQASFESTFYNDHIHAWQAVQKFMIQYQAKKLGPTMVMVHSPIAKQIPSLVKALSDFPTLIVPYADKRPILPPLGWQAYLAHRLMPQLFELSMWLSDHITWSQYANLPVCNMLGDAPLFAADVLLARQLIKNQQMLWWSPTNTPDLGGKEFDESRLMVDHDLALPTYDYPQANPAICFEIALDNLAANTILNSHLINELEGISQAMDLGNKLNGAFQQLSIDGKPAEQDGSNQFLGDPDTIHPATFEVLKSTLRGWCSELVGSNCGISEQIVKHLFRWLTTKSSHLYDPQLHALVIQLMGKLFHQLLAAIREAGGVIMHASPQRIVVGTNKITLANGEVYRNYLLNSVLSQPLFRHLGMTVVQTWHRLIWMSPSNYGGVLAISNQQDSRQIEDCSMDDAEDIGQEDYNLEMSWAIASYLPPIVSPYFDLAIAKFLKDLHLARITSLQTNSHFSQANTTIATETEIGVALLELDIGPKLIDMVPDLQASVEIARLEDNPDILFQNLPNSPYHQHHVMSASYSPVLEWVKGLCYVLGLDKRFKDEVDILKTNLLKLIHVNPHSDQAIFHGPNQKVDLDSKPEEMINDEGADTAKPNQITRSHKNNNSKKLELPNLTCKLCNFYWKLDFYEHLCSLKRIKESENSKDDMLGDILGPEEIQAGHGLDSPSFIAPNQPVSKPQEFVALQDILNQPFPGLACPSCSSLHPPSLIEDTLLTQLNIHITAYQLQDLTCSKCHNQPQSLLSSQCRQCTLDLINVQYPDDQFRDWVEKLDQLANTFGLERVTLACKLVLKS